MSTQDLVSIVLPTYNGARYLPQAIESCLQQTHSNLELIIVDDASTDDTPAIIARYAQRDPRIRPHRNPANRKLPASLNAGFSLARGDFLTWTSDDNCYRPNALAEMLACLQQRPDIHLVYAGMTWIDANDATLRYDPPRPPSDLPLGNCIGACFLYRRQVHQTLGGYAEDRFLVEDYDFWLRATLHFQLQPLDRDLYLYRTHDASLSGQQPLRVRLASERLLLERLPQLHWLTRRARGNAYWSLGHAARQRGDHAAALKFTLRAARYIPLTVLRREIGRLRQDRALRPALVPGQDANAL